MIEPDTMSREGAAEFLAALRKLRDGMDSFNCQVVTLNSSGLRLAEHCEEAVRVAPANATTLTQGLISVATSLRSFSVTIGEALPCLNCCIRADVAITHACRTGSVFLKNLSCVMKISSLSRNWKYL